MTIPFHFVQFRTINFWSKSSSSNLLFFGLKITRSAARINFDQFSHWNQSKQCVVTTFEKSTKRPTEPTNTTNGNNRHEYENPENKKQRLGNQIKVKVKEKPKWRERETCWILTDSILATVSNTLTFERNNILQAIILLFFPPVFRFSSFPFLIALFGFDAHIFIRWILWWWWCCWLCAQHHNQHPYVLISLSLLFLIYTVSYLNFVRTKRRAYALSGIFFLSKMFLRRTTFANSIDAKINDQNLSNHIWLSRVMKKSSNAKSKFGIYLFISSEYLFCWIFLFQSHFLYYLNKQYIYSERTGRFFFHVN